MGRMMMLNSVKLTLSNKELIIHAQSISIFDIYIPTVLLIIFTILLLKLLLHLQYCFLVQWTTQMVTILESRCPIFISMKPITTTLNSYNKIRQTQQQPNKYNTTCSTNSTFSTPTTTTPTRAQFSRSSDYYYLFALTKPSCTPMIIGLTETAHSPQLQS